MESSPEMDAIFDRIFASQNQRKENSHSSLADTAELRFIDDDEVDSEESKEPQVFSVSSIENPAKPKEPKNPANTTPIVPQENPKVHQVSPGITEKVQKEPKKDTFDQICESFVEETKKDVSKMPNLSPEKPSTLEKFVEEYVNIPKRELAIKEATEKQARENRLNTIISILGEDRCKAFCYKDSNSINYRGKAFGVSIFEDDDSLLPIEFACTIRAFIPESHIVPIECRDYVNPHQFPVKLEEPEKNYFVLSKDNSVAYDASHNFILIQDDKFLILIKNENVRVSAHFYQK